MLHMSQIVVALYNIPQDVVVVPSKINCESPDTTVWLYTSYVTRWILYKTTMWRSYQNPPHPKLNQFVLFSKKTYGGSWPSQMEVASPKQMLLVMKQPHTNVEAYLIYVLVKKTFEDSWPSQLEVASPTIKCY